MRTYLRFAGLALGTVLFTAPLAAQGFEGVVAYRMPSMKGAGAEMTMSIKGTQMRTDMVAEGRTMSMLLDGQAGTMTMLMAEQRMYMTMDMKAMRDRAQAMKHGDQTPPKITALGTTETIAGRSCENYQVETEKTKMEFCNAKGLGNFMAVQSPMGRGGASPLQDLDNEAYRTYFKEGFFPLRVSNYEGGTKKVVMEATRVEPKSLDASLFQIPAGFTEMKMPGKM
jgi:Domain of unknown function (DUF4412)